MVIFSLTKHHHFGKHLVTLLSVQGDLFTQAIK